MTTPTVLIDIDGVLTEFDVPFLKLLNLIEGGEPRGFAGGTPVPTTWSWMTAAGFSKATIDAAWDYVKAMPEWWYSLRPYPGAIEFICDLMEARDNGELNPYFVTSRPMQAVADVTHRWLLSCGASRPNAVVVSGTGAKGKIAAATGATAILDDYPLNFAGVPHGCRTYLRDRPWNQDECYEGAYDYRTYSLTDFLAAVRGPRVLPSFAPKEAA